MSKDPASGFPYLRTLFRWRHGAEGTWLEFLPGAACSEDDLRRAFPAAGILNGNAGAVVSSLRSGETGWHLADKTWTVREESSRAPLRARVDDPMLASVWIDPAGLAEQGRVVDAPEIRRLLEAEGVRLGIRDAEIGEILQPGVPAGWYPVARGERPVDGTDTEIVPLIELGGNALPSPEPDGSVDLRDRGRLPEVVEGTALCRRRPGRPKKDGFDVLGHVQEARSGEEKALPVSSNTRVSEADSDVLEAACDGFLFLGRDGCVRVGRVFEVRGDLDLAVGNIRYHGPVEIRGKVPTGFVIEAGGDVIVHGAAEAATIESARGAVEVHGGVFGGHIRAAEHIEVAFAHDATLETPGEIRGGKYLQHCQVRCASLRFRAGLLVGGSVVASRSVACDVLGTEAGTPTHLRLADPAEDAAISELEVVAIEEKKHAQLREILEQKVLAVRQRLAKGGGLLGRAREEAEESLKQYAAITALYRELAERRDKAQAVLALERVREGEIEVRKDVHPGVEMHIFGRRVEPATVRPPVRIDLDESLEIRTRRI